jgi:CheY-like chemotaxis protein
VDLSAVVRESTALLEAAIPGPGHLKLELGASVPAIEADPSQVRQILVSLVTNAGEALENGHGTVTVRTGSLIADQAYLQSTALPDRPPEGRYGFLEVVDDGTGMSEAVQQRMFEPFYSTRFSGRGLGLAAVSGIVRRHRGTIQVTSAPGEGTAIRVLFPLAGRPERAELAPCAVAGEPAEGKVLLVDDEADVLRLMRKFLGRAGFEVHPAASGEEGLARFKELGGSLDAVILDLTMPGMGGDELLAAIRQLDQTVPVIVASGYTEDEVARRCAGLNISAFLPKPYLPAELTAELRRAITAGRPRPVGSRSQV